MAVVELDPEDGPVDEAGVVLEDEGEALCTTKTATILNTMTTVLGREVEVEMKATAEILTTTEEMNVGTKTVLPGVVANPAIETDVVKGTPVGRNL